MSISILGGKAKGHKLQVKELKNLRPTSVLLKRKIFDKFQNLEGHTFIDAFAGTASMALEAWSRGSDKIFVNELDLQTFNLAKQNISSLSSYELVKENYELTNLDVSKFLQYFFKIYLKWDQSKQEKCILFIDPPYEMKHLYDAVSKLLKSEKYIGSLWIESDRQKGMNENEVLEAFSLEGVNSKVLKQGTRFFVITDFSII